MKLDSSNQPMQCTASSMETYLASSTLFCYRHKKRKGEIFLIRSENNTDELEYVVGTGDKLLSVFSLIQSITRTSHHPCRWSPIAATVLQGIHNGGWMQHAIKWLPILNGLLKPVSTGSMELHVKQLNKVVFPLCMLLKWIKGEVPEIKMDRPSCLSGRLHERRIRHHQLVDRSISASIFCVERLCQRQGEVVLVMVDMRGPLRDFEEHGS